MKKTKKHLEDNFVDVCVGKMTLEQLGHEINHYIYEKSPEYMIVTIEHLKLSNKYNSTIYLTKKDFKKNAIYKKK